MPKKITSRQTKSRLPGGWLVTYADLMTILVCFFVLIVSYSIQDQVKMEVVAGSMRDAFGVAEQRRYAGDIKLDGVPEERQPGNVRSTAMPSGEGFTTDLAAYPNIGSSGRNGGFEHAAAEQRRFEATKIQLQNAILNHPILKDASEAITINQTEDGLQVLLVDTAGRPMFPVGSKEPTELARNLLIEITRTIKPLANRIIIAAHADAIGTDTYSPFQLTAERANVARQIIEIEGLDPDRISGIIGRGEAHPLYPEDPFAPGNRRIEIILERSAPLFPIDGVL